MMAKHCHDQAHAMALFFVPLAGRLCRLAFLFATLLFSSWALAADIGGLWKHIENPVWIEIRIDQGDGIVVRNDKFPERVGDVFLKGLKADKTKQGIWYGTVYIHKLAAYKKVEIALTETSAMQITGSVGFFSRSIDWIKVD
jgi:hypothetical protein